MSLVVTPVLFGTCRTLKMKKLSSLSLIHLMSLLVLLQLGRARGEASLHDAVAATRAKYSGVGLTAWSVDADGRLCSLGAAGERIKGSGEPFQVTGDSRHHIGSVTKSMTASIMAILMEDGTIPFGWNATLESVLPIARNTSYSDVTLRELVGHLTGIADPQSPEDIDVLLDFEDVREARRAVTVFALQSTPVSPPGTAFLYSNINFIIAGHIIEEILDMTWEKALVERLFLPLGIHLGLDPSNFTGAPNNNVDPWGHKGDAQIPCNPANETCDNPAILGPAGTFSGPLAAMARYFAWHIQCHNGGIPDDDPSAVLLSQQSCLELHQPANSTIGEYGYGWICTEEQKQWANGLVCLHDGSNTLNYYEVALAFNLSRAFVGFTNGFGRANDTDVLMVTDAVIIASTGDQQCDARIPSSVYIANNNGTSAPTRGPAPTSAPVVTGAPTRGPAPTSAPVDTSNAGGSVQCLFWFNLLYALLLITFDIV